MDKYFSRFSKAASLRFNDIFYMGASMLLLPAFLSITGSLVLLAGGALSPWLFPAGVALSLMVCGIGTRRWSPVWYLVIFYALSLLLAAWFVDWSFDGLSYHQETADRFMTGWNPYHNFSDNNPEDFSLWCLTYAKTLELMRGIVGLTFGFLEIGKVVNIFLWGSSIMLAWCAISKLIQGTRRRLWITAIAAANPVVITQLLTFYVDFSSYCFWLSSLSLIVLISDGTQVWKSWALLFLVTILSIGTKYNIFFFQGYLLICWGLWLLINKDFKRFSILVMMGLATLLVGVLVINYHPYITNTLAYGNPFYPILGNNSKDVMTHTTPDLMLRLNSRPLNFIVSNFTFSLPSYDTRVGGFGPCMGLLIVISIILCVKYRKTIKRPAIFALICIALSLFIMKESWWARFTTQLWLIPIIVMISVPRDWLRRLMSFLLIITMALTLPALVYAWSYSYHFHWLCNILRGETIKAEMVFPHLQHRMEHHDILFIEAPIDSTHTILMDLPTTEMVEVPADKADQIDGELTKPSIKNRLLHPAKFR